MDVRIIDHFVLPVASLVEARDRYLRLGFQVAPEAHHPFGTANACVFLEDGVYLEPLAVADRRKAGICAKKGNVFTDRDLVFRGRKNAEGLSALVVQSADANADHDRFTASGIALGTPLEFSRPVMSPDGEEKEARFRLAFAGSGDASGFFAFACERSAPFPPGLDPLRAHPNAVAGVKEVVLVAADPSHSCSWLAEVVRATPEDVEGGVLLQAQDTTIRIVRPDHLAQEFGLPVQAEAIPLAARGIVFRTDDLAVTEITLAANDVAFIRRGGRVLVSPARGQGVTFGFEE